MSPTTPVGATGVWSTHPEAWITSGVNTPGMPVLEEALRVSQTTIAAERRIIHEEGSNHSEYLVQQLYQAQSDHGVNQAFINEVEQCARMWAVQEARMEAVMLRQSYATKFEQAQQQLSEAWQAQQRQVQEQVGTLAQNAAQAQERAEQATGALHALQGTEQRMVREASHWEIEATASEQRAVQALRRVEEEQLLAQAMGTQVRESREEAMRCETAQSEHLEQRRMDQHALEEARAYQALAGEQNRNPMHELTQDFGNTVTQLRCQLEEHENQRIQGSNERERLIIDLQTWELWHAENTAPLEEEARQAVVEIAALREASQQQAVQQTQRLREMETEVEAARAGRPRPFEGVALNQAPTAQQAMPGSRGSWGSLNPVGVATRVALTPESGQVPPSAYLSTVPEPTPPCTLVRSLRVPEHQPREQEGVVQTRRVMQGVHIVEEMFEKAGCL